MQISIALLQGFPNCSGSGPTWEYLSHLATHWMKWVLKIPSWTMVKICPFADRV